MPNNNNTKKAPLIFTPIPEKPWENISIDLFSPLQDQRHILVVRCNLSRFPDAKIVRSTGTQYVLPALGEIYKNFGNPECHKYDNGPTFNGQEFHNWSTKQGIKIKASYPYHPQGNEAECFMKPLKKGIEIELEKRRPIQEIIDELLHDCRSTPHPATGLTPGDMMLRGGYWTKFPQQTNPTENQIQEAKIRDSHWKEVAIAKINASCWRKYPKIIQGDKVLVKRSSKTNKFVSQFDPTPQMVTDIQGSRYELVADNDHKTAHSIFRHISDIKLYKPHQHPQRYHPHPHPVQTQI